MSDKREWIEIIETKSDLIERRKQLFDFRYCDLFRIPVYGEVGTAVKLESWNSPAVSEKSD